MAFQLRPLVAGVLVAGAAVAVAACHSAGVEQDPAGSSQPDAPPAAAQPAAAPSSSGPAGTPVAPRTVLWVDLAVGECLADPPSTDPSEVMVTVVDCATPHAAEVYLRVPIPVNDAVATVADEQCAAGLPPYTGAPAAEGRYQLTYLIDSEQDRTANNPEPSTVICLLHAADGEPMTATAHR